MDLAKQHLPPEFKFQDTQVFTSVPPGNLIYTKGLGSWGSNVMPKSFNATMSTLRSGPDVDISIQQQTSQALGRLAAYNRIMPDAARARAIQGTINTAIENHPLDKRPVPGGYDTLEEALSTRSYHHKAIPRMHTSEQIRQALFVNNTRMGAVANNGELVDLGQGVTTTARGAYTAPKALQQLLQKKEAEKAANITVKTNAVYHPSELMTNGQPRPDRIREDKVNTGSPMGAGTTSGPMFTNNQPKVVVGSNGTVNTGSPMGAGMTSGPTFTSNQPKVVVGSDGTVNTTWENPPRPDLGTDANAQLIGPASASGEDYEASSGDYTASGEEIKKGSSNLVLGLGIVFTLLVGVGLMIKG